MQENLIKIYSKIEPTKLLHIMYNIYSVDNRVDLIPENEFLQCAVIKKQKDVTFKAHKHIYKPIEHTKAIAQESWLILKGRVLVYHYDIDDSLIGTREICEGWINITLFGGHTMKILEDNTIICEQKNGPYHGVNFDKAFI